MKKFITTFLVAISAASLRAQLPCETVLLVNTNSLDSLKIANNYIKMRAIPLNNVIYLGVDGDKAEISHADFTAKIWEPANAELKKRGIDSQVSAWVYSASFPFRVKNPTEPTSVPEGGLVSKDLSITGLTFMRNRLPNLQKISDNAITVMDFSPLFRGPGENPKIQTQATGSFDRFTAGLKEKMPLPSMMLGYTGERGNSVDEVLLSLELGVAGDSTMPNSGINFVKTVDKARSTPREWQFGPTQLELAQKMIEATTTTNFPANSPNVMGLMTGQANLNVKAMPNFHPGAVADNLTSWSAMFDNAGQSKCSDWIRAGATATAGTVTEPFAIWWKFPHARFFSHYASGCTIIESFYQSILNPTQTLLIGEPLCRPWRKKFNIVVDGYPTKPISEKVTISAKCQPQINGPVVKYTFYIDGKIVKAESPSFIYQIDPTTLSDGFHELMVTAKVNLPVNHGTQAQGGFIVNRFNQMPVVTGVDQPEPGVIGVKFAVPENQSPKTVRLYCGNRLVDEVEYSKEKSLKFDEKTVGEGPNTIQVAAIYEDGKEVRSAPIGFEIKFAEPE